MARSRAFQEQVEAGLPYLLRGKRVGADTLIGAIGRVCGTQRQADDGLQSAPMLLWVGVLGNVGASCLSGFAGRCGDDTAGRDSAYHMVFRIGHIQVAVRTYRDALGFVKPRRFTGAVRRARIFSQAGNRRHRPFRSKLANRVVERVGEINNARTVNHYALRLAADGRSPALAILVAAGVVELAFSHAAGQNAYQTCRRNLLDGAAKRRLAKRAEDLAGIGDVKVAKTVGRNAARSAADSV